MSETKSTARYRPETRLVQSGTFRSQFGETSEAMFLTQGFVYDSAEQCEARFTGDEPGFLYARFSNPTVAMFEQRMAAFEGAEAARATASGMAAVTAAMPLAVARAASAPSNAAMRCSNMATVGLENRA
jgi:O-succinylhomoserine sulfhydrylase